MKSTRSVSPSPRLLALGTATPSHSLEQADVAARAGRIFAPVSGGMQRLLPLYRNAAVETRQSCMPIDWFESEHGFGSRNALFLEYAPKLLQQAAIAALDEASLGVDDIDIVVTVTSSGIATPSLDARMMQLLGCRPDVMRVPLVGLGCAGGVLGLARAAAFARAQPGAHVLLLVVELCGLTFRRNDLSKSNIVATALFGDGAAAAVITAGAGHDTAPEFGPAGEHTWPQSLDVMGWDVVDDGLKVVFSRSIPDLVRRELRSVADRFFHRHGLDLAKFDGILAHPGGAKVVDALEACFDLPAGAMTFSRDVLRRHGNMSAVTLLFVIQAALAAGETGQFLLTALGPGFSAGFQMLQVPPP